MPHEGRGEMSARDHKTRSVFYLLALLAIVGWAYLFLRSDWFLVKQIQASGLTSMDEVDLTRIVFQALDTHTGWRPWDPRHSLFIDQKKLAESLKQTLFAESVQVEVDHRHILRLMMKERPHRVVLMTQNASYWLSLTGALQEELSAAERKQVSQRLTGRQLTKSDDPPIILSSYRSDQLATSTAPILTSETVKSWIQLSTDLIKANVGYTTLEPSNSVTSTSIQVALSDPSKRLYIEIGDSRAIHAQIQAYKIFLQSKDVSRGDYRLIDLRIPNRIYLRP